MGANTMQASGLVLFLAAFVAIAAGLALGGFPVLLIAGVALLGFSAMLLLKAKPLEGEES